MMELLAELRDHYVAKHGWSDIADNDLDGKAVLTVECGGETAGMVAVHVDGYLATASRLYVRPAHRGHGHAPELVRQAVRAAREAGARSLRGDVDKSAAPALAHMVGAVPTAPFGTHAHDSQCEFVETRQLDHRGLSDD